MSLDQFEKAIASGLQPAVTLADAEKAGYDAGRNGPNTTNCHLRYFATPERTKAWERGKAKAGTDAASLPSKEGK